MNRVERDSNGHLGFHLNAVNPLRFGDIVSINAATKDMSVGNSQ